MEKAKVSMQYLPRAHRTVAPVDAPTKVRRMSRARVKLITVYNASAVQKLALADSVVVDDARHKMSDY
jgi:hypothetical protein